jgi:excisionase family DNA binding protein
VTLARAHDPLAQTAKSQKTPDTPADLRRALTPTLFGVPSHNPAIFRKKPSTTPATGDRPTATPDFCGISRVSAEHHPPPPAHHNAAGQRPSPGFLRILRFVRRHLPMNSAPQERALDDHDTLTPPADDDTTLVLLKVEEAARRLRIGRTTCFALIRTGELESIEIGRLRRVPADAPAEFLARRRAAKRAA